MSKILLEENKQYEFDFSELDYVWQMHDIASKTTMLNDVDFITQINKEILFIEYKNASIKGADKPDAMLEKIKEKSEEFYKKIARKYYDSLFLLWACNKNEENLPIVYILLIEHPKIDKKIRRKLELKIKRQLPFNLKSENITREIISKFHVYNLQEWQDNVPQIQIRYVGEVI